MNNFVWVYTNHCLPSIAVERHAEYQGNTWMVYDRTWLEYPRRLESKIFLLAQGAPFVGSLGANTVTYSINLHAEWFHKEVHLKRSAPLRSSVFIYSLGLSRWGRVGVHSAADN